MNKIYDESLKKLKCWYTFLVSIWLTNVFDEYYLPQTFSILLNNSDAFQFLGEHWYILKLFYKYSI